MGRSRQRERFFQKQEREKRAALAQGYGMGDVKVARITGEYPPRDHLKERLNRE